MDTIRVVVSFDGLEQALARLSEMEEAIPANLQTQTASLAQDTRSAWQQRTPSRSGRLRGADTAEVADLSFTLENPTRYYEWVDKGHNTPAGWRTKHGYRPAKKRSHVAGRNMTPAATSFITQNIVNYLSKSFENI